MFNHSSDLKAAAARRSANPLPSLDNATQSVAIAAAHTARHSAEATAERTAYRDAVRDSAGTMPGVFAWAIVTGMAMMKAGLTIKQAIGMTFFVFAASAQLATLPLVVTHAPFLVIFATALVVNLRFVIFSAAISPHLVHLNWRHRLCCGYFTSDLLMAFFPKRFPYSTVQNPVGKVGYFWGVSNLNWIVWQSGALAGIFMAGYIPSNWQIGFAGTLALLAVMIPLTMNVPALIGVIVSGAVAVAGAGLPLKLGLLLAVACGMVAAMLADRWRGNDGSQATGVEAATEIAVETVPGQIPTRREAG
jgi:predicted branched-subunit amino acid permease